MAPKTKVNQNEPETESEQNTITSTSPVKAKRGRKSKKELMAALNITEIVKEKDSKKNQTNNNANNQVNNANVNDIINDNNIINLNVSEIENDSYDNAQNQHLYEDILNETTLNFENNSLNEDSVLENDILNETNTEINNIINLLDTGEPKLAKKRGRKPKGGKIIQQLSTNICQKDEKINVILHLKCSMKDLQTYSQNNDFVESYNFSNSKSDLNYELIGNENNVTKSLSSINTLDTENDCEDYDDDSVCKDSTREIHKKLKQLEHNLHINNVNNKRSACFWDTCEFDNPPIHIPKHFINGTYHVYGCFCSPECGVAYLMNENIDSSTKFERYHLFNLIYTKIYNYEKNIKPAPNPYYMLEKYYGNLSIQEYRSLLRNERLFLIVDKPLTRILPELHEDNDDFILNNKIIPSNNYNVKTRLQKKKQNKNSIITEKFGNTYQ